MSFKMYKIPISNIIRTKAVKSYKLGVDKNLDLVIEVSNPRYAAGYNMAITSGYH